LAQDSLAQEGANTMQVAPPQQAPGLGLPKSGPGSRASTGRRAAALLIDWIAALLVARLLFPALEYGSQPAGLATLGVFALEVTILTWLTGSSFGQRLVGVAVVGRSRRLGLVAVALRTLLICLVIPPVIWDGDGRGLHDRAVDSVVVVR
jgi:hypothetical protein